MARAFLWTTIVAVLAGVGSFLLPSKLLVPNDLHPTADLYPTNLSLAARLPRAPARAAHSSSPGGPIALADASDQATRGAQVYAMHCITCHGDRGQGLTLEWRLTWDDEHQNCAKPKCHGRDNPEGFYLPNMYAPAIVGPDTLEEFQTAKDLFDFVSTRMPFQEPGILPQEDYWALAAFLLQRNGLALPGAEIGVGNASMILLRPQPILPTAPATSGTR